jgi:hypothetical protein
MASSIGRSLFFNRLGLGERAEDRPQPQPRGRKPRSCYLAVVRQFDGWVRCGRPAGEEIKGTLRGRTGLGGAGEDPLTEVIGEFKGFVSEAKISDDRVMETFCAGAVELHVVSGPADPELLTAGR